MPGATGGAPLIPRVLHVCWFGGGPKPPLLRRCEQSWSRHLPGWDIQVWTEDTFDLSGCGFAVRAHEAGKYAFVSDYVRAAVLAEHGGVYVDTDVELRRSLEPVLSTPAFLGFIYDCLVGTAVMGAMPRHELMVGLRDAYVAGGVPDDEVNNHVVTDLLLRRFPEFRLDGKRQALSDGTVVYPRGAFERSTFQRGGGFAVHHAVGSWRGERSRAVRVAKRVIPARAVEAVVHQRALRSSHYFPTYVRHREQL